MLEVVVLAAGQGTRMNSKKSKVLHEILGRPMLGHVLSKARALNPDRIVVVTGHRAEEVETYLQREGVVFARQKEQLGTGHAFAQAVPHLDGSGDIVVLCGDTPLVTTETLQGLLDQHREKRSALTVLTSSLVDPTGYGRILRDNHGNVLAIVEEKVATEEQKAIREFNSGVYVMDPKAKALVEEITDGNGDREYYLTDLIELYRKRGSRVDAFHIRDSTELQGVNDRTQLADAARVMRQRINRQWMKLGVTLLDPDSTSIDDTVSIGRDTTLGFGVQLIGKTQLGEGVSVGPFSVLIDTVVEDGVQIKSHSVIESSRLARQSQVGPFARLRPGTQLAEEVHVGNFVEIKNSSLGKGTKAGHLAYVGDAQIGVGVNIGAGTIVANFDGAQKHLTQIDDRAFIGSNSVLIAPIRIGREAMVAAGSAVTQDVPEGDLAVARGRQENKTGLARKRLQKTS